MSSLKLLWMDMTVEGSAPEVPATITDRFHVIRSTNRLPTAQQLKAMSPDAVVFDFDYPDRMSLSMAAKLKEDHPSIPMVLLTVQHSEALAVWAFRARFADFLVRPVNSIDLDRCLMLLEDIAGERRTQAHRHMPTSSAPIPAEVPAAIGGARSLQPALQFMESNLGSKIVAEEMAKLCLMSPYRFSREFKEAFGLTFREYILRARLNEAARLLENPQVPVTQVAYAVGFNDMSHFSRMFRRHFGITPSAAQVTFQITGKPAGKRTMDLPAQQVPDLASTTTVRQLATSAGPRPATR